MDNQLIELLKRILVQQKLDSLAGSHLSRLVLFLNPRRSATEFSLLLLLAKKVELGARWFGLLL
jgi:hypothetical protein